MDRDELRSKRRSSFLEKRRKAAAKVMENHPEGITRKNLSQIKKEIHKEERS